MPSCSFCGTSNPEGARFCLNCGTPITARTLARPDLERYLPTSMLERLRAARTDELMVGERRVVTMLFCDVKGSTAMAENLDPEEWAEVMNGAFEHLIAPVYRYEGTLARLMGDAIFAFFGAPIAHEDDPERAVLAGLEIIEGIGSYREKVKAERDLDLNVRVGINTGPVMVGQVGSDLRLEYTAMGDAVNVAARMEQTAEPGTVQITADTYRLVGPRFEVESRGHIDVKGKSEPVASYRVIGRTSRPGRLRGVDGRESPLVGRDREISVLREAVADVHEGRGRIVSLIGEAGLGKSRLIEETRGMWTARVTEDSRSATGAIHRIWETWQCVSYDTVRPYAQYRRMLAGIAGIADTDPPDVVRGKLAATIEASPDDPVVEWHMRVWRSLFGVPEVDEEPLDGEAFRDAIMELVPGSTRQFGSSAPRLLVFEDLHWCDEASMDVLIETAKLVDELPCLFLFAYRPDRHSPSWRLKQWLETEYPHRSTEIVLAPLSEADSDALIDELLPNGEALDTVRAQILVRTEGNPLFVEELVAALVDQPSESDGGVGIPPTLQALITARLDRLDEGARYTLQLASVIGRSFSQPVLHSVAGDGGELERRLSRLEKVGLIHLTAASPEREYTFRHSLTQEATYDTILLRGRRELHQRVGEALEELYASRIEEFAPLLARHFQEAGDDERTLSYATTAGDSAARLYANAEAVTHYSAAIRAADRMGVLERSLEHLYMGRGRALVLGGRFDEAVANYEEMETAAQTAGDPATVLQARLTLTTLYSTPTAKFDPMRGRELSEETLSLARELGDRVAESKALWNLMILNVYGGGDLQEALEVGQRSLAIARELDAREQMAFTLNDLWRPYAAVGDLRSSRASLDEARSLWRELDNLPMLSENLASSASLRRLAGEYRESVELSDEATEIARGIDNLWGQAYGLMTAYDVHLQWGDVGRAMAMMSECIALSERVGFVPPQAVTRADLGSVYGSLGNPGRGLELVSVALDVAMDRSPAALAWVIGTKAQLHLLENDLDRAEATVAEANVDLLPEPLRSAGTILVALVRGRIASARDDHTLSVEIADDILDLLRRRGIRQYTVEALLLKGRSLAAGERREEAREVLLDARSTAESLGSRWVLWEVLGELSRIEAAEGNVSDASALRADARQIVEGIAASIEDEALRSSYLARPDALFVSSGSQR
jgi:class 3 adenylate cyclase/tetratricopeptide (TPR) repeat protein